MFGEAARILSFKRRSEVLIKPGKRLPNGSFFPQEAVFLPNPPLPFNNPIVPWCCQDGMLYFACAFGYTELVPALLVVVFQSYAHNQQPSYFSSKPQRIFQRGYQVASDR